MVITTTIDLKPHRDITWTWQDTKNVPNKIRWVVPIPRQKNFKNNNRKDRIVYFFDSLQFTKPVPVSRSFTPRYKYWISIFNRISCSSNPDSFEKKDTSSSSIYKVRNVMLKRQHPLSSVSTMYLFTLVDTTVQILWPSSNLNYVSDIKRLGIRSGIVSRICVLLTLGLSTTINVTTRHSLCSPFRVSRVRI